MGAFLVGGCASRDCPRAKAIRCRRLVSRPSLKPVRALDGGSNRRKAPKRFGLDPARRMRVGEDMSGIRQIRLKGLASELGLSITQVSRALAGISDVSA